LSVEEEAGIGEPKSGGRNDFQEASSLVRRWAGGFDLRGSKELLDMARFLLSAVEEEESMIWQF
jgi:hypothetical protein